MCIKLRVKWFIAAEYEACSIPSPSFLWRCLDEVKVHRQAKLWMSVFAATRARYDSKGNLEWSEIFHFVSDGGRLGGVGPPSWHSLLSAFVRSPDCRR